MTNVTETCLARVVRLPLLMIALAGSTAAQAPTSPPVPTDAEIATLPLVGAHVVALAPGEAPEVTILLPRPLALEIGDPMAALADDCLELTGLADRGSGEALALGARLVGDRLVGAGQHGDERCATTVVVSFGTGSGRLQAAVAVVIARVAAPAAAPGVSASLSVDSIALPAELAGADPLAESTLLHLRLTNASTDPVSIDRLVEEAALAEWVGTIFTLSPGAYDGTWASLATGVDGFVPTRLAPGDSVEYVIVLARPGRVAASRVATASMAAGSMAAGSMATADMATGSWAVTVRPAFEVVIGGERFSLVLERVSIAASHEVR